MARIAGINIPPNQHAEIGLTAIYGIAAACPFAVSALVRMHALARVRRKLASLSKSKVKDDYGRKDS